MPNVSSEKMNDILENNEFIQEMIACGISTHYIIRIISVYGTTIIKVMEDIWTTLDSSNISNDDFNKYFIGRLKKQLQKINPDLIEFDEED